MIFPIFLSEGYDSLYIFIKGVSKSLYFYERDIIVSLVDQRDSVVSMVGERYMIVSIIFIRGVSKPLFFIRGIIL